MRTVNIAELRDPISDEEFLLVAVGKIRLPRTSIRVGDLAKVRTGKVAGSKAIQALLDDREESR